jgi:ferrous iron transport protein A
MSAMPLTMAAAGDESFIIKVGGPPDTRQFLEKLGFVPGSRVTVVSKAGGNVIVSVKESRVAVSREMASKILV